MSKKRLWVVGGIGGVFGLLLTGLVLVFFFFPERLLAGVNAMQARRAGMSLKAVEVKGYRIPYYVGGSGPPLVLLHGFADEKTSFLQTAQWLTPHYTTYLPDLPGYGETARDPDRKYGISSQAQTVADFTEALGLRELHLGGNSMGGHVAAAFARTHPKAVLRLLLLDPAGMRGEGPPLYQNQAQPVDTPAKYDAFLQRVFAHPPAIPGPLKGFFVQRAIRNFSWLNRMLQEVREDPDYELNDRIKDITAPTLILWGSRDGIIPVAHAPLWHAGIAGSTLIVWDDCGHAPQHERPQQTARLMLDFLAGRCGADGCPQN